MYLSGYDLREIANRPSSKLSPSGEYICICPHCQSIKGKDYSKAKLYIMKNFSTGYCFVCGNTFLGKKDSSIVMPLPTINVETPANVDIQYHGNPVIAQESIDYLYNRCPALYSGVDFQQLGFVPTIRKIIIRFFLGLREYYYQIRYLHPDEDNQGRRYYSPPVLDSGKPVYIVGGKFDALKPTILVEGVFTALAEYLILKSEVNVLAMLGHTPSKFQTTFLQNLGCYQQLFVHMDTTAYSSDFLKKFSQSYPTARIIPSYSDKYDSEEIIAKGILSVESYENYLKAHMKPQYVLSIQ